MRNCRDKHKGGPFSTDLELEELQRCLVAGAVVSQTRKVFIACENWSCLSDGFVKPRCTRNAQSFAVCRTNVGL